MRPTYWVQHTMCTANATQPATGNTLLQEAYGDARVRGPPCTARARGMCSPSPIVTARWQTGSVHITAQSLTRLACPQTIYPHYICGHLGTLSSAVGVTATVGLEARCARTCVRWRTRTLGAVDKQIIYHTDAESNQQPHLADSGKQNVIPLHHLLFLLNNT